MIFATFYIEDIETVWVVYNLKTMEVVYRLGGWVGGGGEGIGIVWTGSCTYEVKKSFFC